MRLVAFVARCLLGAVFVAVGKRRSPQRLEMFAQRRSAFSQRVAELAHPGFESREHLVGISFTQFFSCLMSRPSFRALQVIDL